MSFKVWGSENLVPRATLYTETIAIGTTISEAETKLKIMNPRYRAECIDFETSSSSSRFVRFDLPEPVYIEYIHTYSKPYAIAGSCVNTMSNRYFYSRKYNVTPGTAWNDPDRALCERTNPKKSIDFANEPDISLISPNGECNDL